MNRFVSRARRIVAVAGAVLMLCGAAPAGLPATSIELPTSRAATMSSHASSLVMLGVARAGDRLVAVGERGAVLLSDDAGLSWRQVNVPTSATLTAVKFATPRVGWAVGHYGVILASRDAGETWVRQFDGDQAAAIALQAARRTQAGSSQPSDPVKPTQSTKALAEAERLVADGPDKPFLDLHFFDERHGFVVGAYNLVFETDDGGTHWRPRLDALDNPRGNHLYAAAGSGRTLYIAGEQGVMFRSDDAGRTFTRLAIPYAGSFFALALLPLPAPGGSVVVAGLRGNAFVSADHGVSWRRLEGLPPVSILSAAVAPDQTLWLGNQAGQLFTGRDGDRSFALRPALPDSPPLPLTQVLPDGRRVVLASLRGMARFPLHGVR